MAVEYYKVQDVSKSETALRWRPFLSSVVHTLSDSELITTLNNRDSITGEKADVVEESKSPGVHSTPELQILTFMSQDVIHVPTHERRFNMLLRCYTYKLVSYQTFGVVPNAGRYTTSNQYHH